MKTKQDFLDGIKEKGFSSPAGIHWDRFCNFIKRKSIVDDQERLLNPLILSGSVGSHADKHERLTEHLDWAERHGCIDEAIDYLERLLDSEEKWNVSQGDDWDKEHPWVRGEW